MKMKPYVKNCYMYVLISICSLAGTVCVGQTQTEASDGIIIEDSHDIDKKQVVQLIQAAMQRKLDQQMDDDPRPPHVIIEEKMPFEKYNLHLDIMRYFFKDLLAVLSENKRFVDLRDSDRLTILVATRENLHPCKWHVAVGLKDKLPPTTILFQVPEVDIPHALFVFVSFSEKDPETKTTKNLVSKFYFTRRSVDLKTHKAVWKLHFLGVEPVLVIFAVLAMPQMVESRIVSCKRPTLRVVSRARQVHATQFRERQGYDLGWALSFKSRSLRFPPYRTGCYDQR